MNILSGDFIPLYKLRTPLFVPMCSSNIFKALLKLYDDCSASSSNMHST
jgi:hypothetical protein